MMRLRVGPPKRKRGFPAVVIVASGLGIATGLTLLSFGIPEPADSHGEAVDLGTLGGSMALAYAVNDFGVAVGFGETENGEWRAFRWSGSSGMQVLPDLGGSVSMASDINNYDQIAGVNETPEGVSHLALWQADGSLRDLGTLNGVYAIGMAINDEGTIAASRFSAGRWQAVTWSESLGIVELGTLGGGNSLASGINKNGDVVGMSTTVSGEWHAFVWHNGVMFDLGTRGGSSSYAAEISDEGLIVGGSSTSTEQMELGLWQFDATKSLLSDIELAGFSGSTVYGYGVDSLQRVVARGAIDSTDAAFVVDEQRSVALLPSLGGDYTDVEGINTVGEAAGWSDTGAGSVHAVLWQPQTVQEQPRLDALKDMIVLAASTGELPEKEAEQIVTKIDQANDKLESGNLSAALEKLANAKLRMEKLLERESGDRALIEFFVERLGAIMVSLEASE